ncbi:PepSY-like domain-containing protein [uncultured Parabacteroides sp.]|uniref:PepSY-like domain-containing protein n=1 Tax=uncultured Parabacteroides sp. TaxID=512312 RepID=UPI0026224475|nr:PepSY-like domain-containing protein [uncultured Parabacteroides sp.]
MRVKASFTAILFMTCCLFMIVGCQQKKQYPEDKPVPQSIQKAILAKYPEATVTGYDKDNAGTEVNIKDKGVKKEVLLGKKDEWLSTKFDIHAEDVPVNIIDNLANSAYHEYRIVEVIQIDKPSGTFYVFKLEHENNEVNLTFNSEAQLLK